MKKEGIGKKEIAEAIKMSNDLPIIKEEYHDISDQLKIFESRETFIF